MLKNKTPLVSVVMPVFNAGIFLRPAIDSILNQTYKNIELIIIDDASTDETPETLGLYRKLDKRVKIFKNKTNLNVSKSASLGISHSKGDFIARMDADDIAFSDRIEKQIEFLTKNKNVIAVGGQCEIIDKNNNIVGYKKFPLYDKEIREVIFSHVPIQQPTLMINKSLLPKNFVWYDENYQSAEELELIFKLFKFGKVRNLKDILLKYRMHDKNTSLINPKNTFYLTLRTRIMAILRYGYVPSTLGIVATIAESILVSLIPNSWIYPIYSHLRGFKNTRLINAKMNLNAELLEA